MYCYVVTGNRVNCKIIPMLGLCVLSDTDRICMIAGLLGLGTSNKHYWDLGSSREQIQPNKSKSDPQNINSC